MRKACSITCTPRLLYNMAHYVYYIAHYTFIIYNMAVGGNFGSVRSKWLRLRIQYLAHTWLKGFGHVPRDISAFIAQWSETTKDIPS